MTVFVPVEGKREALLADLKDGVTRFLFSLENYTSVEGAAEDATDETVENLGWVVAEKVLLTDMLHANLECAYVEGAYEVTNGVEQLGWEVIVYTREWEGRYDASYRDED